MDIYDEHKQLYHYTDYDGLEGIYKNSSLWATHFRDLNDSSECLLMKDVLVERLTPYYMEAMKDHIPSLTYIQQKKIRKKGIPKIAKYDTEKFVKSLYEIAFTGYNEGEYFCEPFILSFCSHNKDDLYIQENGLLSQWRGYAGVGGYAIIFDSKKLCHLLEKEMTLYAYFLSSFGDVVYQGQTTAFEKEFAPFLNALSQEIHKNILTEKLDFNLFFKDMISAFVRFKHQGFSEEREVRFYASPHTKYTRDVVTLNEREPDTRPLKPILTRENGKRYISLLGENYKLPIKQVIVGPSADQQKNYEKARAFLDKSIKVTRSETPYIP